MKKFSVPQNMVRTFSMEPCCVLLIPSPAEVGEIIEPGTSQDLKGLPPLTDRISTSSENLY
jgi:hypothetical protein